MKFITTGALILLLFFLNTTSAWAISNPLATENNYFGIHITDQNDLPDAANLVNSSGGRWGYVTVVIRDDQMDQGYWQDMFNQMRRLNLIPIVRIASHQQGGNWAAPTVEDARKWAEFLHSLNWVTQNRYVVLFNEVNRAHEWGGKLAPAEYAEVIKAYRDELKRLSDDFFVLPAGLDMSAPNSKATMRGLDYYKAMHAKDPNVFSYFDGWTSHSYPNPGADSFKSEISNLAQYGLPQNLPVFITEAGWKNDDPNLVKSFEEAYQKIWSDPQVAAVTPFILNYNGEPFSEFSWKKSDGSFNPQFEAVKKLNKKSGKPVQINSAQIIGEPLPGNLITDSHYLLDVKVKNTGQTIWNRGDIKAIFNNEVFSGTYAEPGQESIISLSINTPVKEQKQNYTLEILFGDKPLIAEVNKEISFIPPTSLSIFSSLAFKLHKQNSSDTSLLIYDGDRFIQKFNNISIKDNRTKIMDLKDVIPGKTYRFVITKPGYLPVQTYEYLDTKITNINFPPLKPFDPNSDGKLTIGDVLYGVTHPLQLIKVLKPF